MNGELNQDGAQALPHAQQSESIDYEITVEYLPASHPFHKSYEGNETVATVRYGQSQPPRSTRTALRGID